MSVSSDPLEQPDQPRIIRELDVERIFECCTQLRCGREHELLRVALVTNGEPVVEKLLAPLRCDSGGDEIVGEGRVGVMAQVPGVTRDQLPNIIESGTIIL
jgi:hypothetical protein